MFLLQYIAEKVPLIDPITNEFAKTANWFLKDFSASFDEWWYIGFVMVFYVAIGILSFTYRKLLTYKKFKIARNFVSVYGVSLAVIFLCCSTKGVSLGLNLIRPYIALLIAAVVCDDLTYSIWSLFKDRRPSISCFGNKKNKSAEMSE